MKNPFDSRAPTFDAEAIHDTIRRALVSAGLEPSSGPMHGVTETIRQALAAAGLARPPSAPAPAEPAIDVVARVVADAGEGRIVESDAAPQPDGTFEAHVFRSHTGSRSYKLYVPAQRLESPPAMVVMLHGCTQSADDFAAGTRMNRLADEHGFLVVYPEQAAQANPSKCWNWFQPQDQRRDAGEPALIAGIVREVAQRHGADPRRIFVAGLSAGAAMAVVLGETYPDLFAGVGVHSGLPYGCAHDVPSALAAMKGGRGKAGPEGASAAAAAPVASRTTTVQAVPAIVFHGDRDHTVQATNGVQIVRQAAEAHRAGGNLLGTTTHAGTVPGGRRFTRTVHADAAGRPHLESWTVHGAGHAWSGGHASGSFTDGSGPDASAEMVRFFLALPRAGSG